MDTLFLFLKKTLTATIFIVFAFVFTYVPVSPVHDTPQVEAAASGSIVFDPTNTFQSSLSAVADTANWTKNNVLDGVAWAFAKQAVSQIMSETINWINSGFEGRPGFVTDLQGFLLSVADETIGDFIQDLGDVGSFICAPFRLDVQVAIATQYSQYRGGDAAQSAPSCTLTGVIDNIQGFIDGTDVSGGLSDWLRITATPQTYTPYGAVLSAEATARARLINAQGEELQLLEFGGGFFSHSVCQTVSGTNDEQCTITNPGALIQDRLSQVVGSDIASLVEADELNELVGALFGQISNLAVTGAAGLLGLSSGNEFSYDGYDGSFLDELVGEANGQILNAGGSTPQDSIADALREERNYRNIAQAHLDELAQFIADPANTTGQRNLAAILNEEIYNEIIQSNEIITTLTDYLNEYDFATQDRQIEILIGFRNLNRTSEVRKTRNINNWRTDAAALGIYIPQYDLSAFDQTNNATSTASSTDTN